MMRLLRDNQTLKQLFLYGVTGILLNALGFGIYLLVIWLGVEPKMAVVLLYPVGVIMSYHANKQIVFSKQSSGKVVFLKFIVAHIGGFLINFFLLFYFYNKLGFPHELVQLAAIFIVALYLFIVFKFLVFKKPSSMLARSV